MFNAERFVGQTLDSLVRQEFQDIEIIVVDDGSTDNSKKVVDAFSFYRNLRYFKKENGGTGSALNFGHDKAVGNYLTWCSADNIYFPNFIMSLLNKLKDGERNGIGLVYGDFYFMGENGEKLQGIKHTRAQTGRDLIEGYDVGMAFLYTRALWEATGYYWNRICEDFHWVVRAAQHAKFDIVNEFLAGFRVHGNQITGNRKQEEKAAADACKQLARQLYGN